MYIKMYEYLNYIFYYVWFIFCMMWFVLFKNDFGDGGYLRSCDISREFYSYVRFRGIYNLIIVNI